MEVTYGGRIQVSEHSLVTTLLWCIHRKEIGAENTGGEKNNWEAAPDTNFPARTKNVGMPEGGGVIRDP